MAIFQENRHDFTQDNYETLSNSTAFCSMTACAPGLFMVNQPTANMLNDMFVREGTSMISLFSSLLGVLFLITGCIPVDNPSRLWGAAVVDTSLEGMWEDDSFSQQYNISYGFTSDGTNMICVSAYQDEDFRTNSPPVFCRSLFDAKTGVGFLLIPKPDALLSWMDDRVAPSSIAVLLPYRMKSDRELLLFEVVENRLAEFIREGKIEGGFIRENAGSSREIFRPIIRNPSLEDLHVIALNAINTNSIASAFRKQTRLRQNKSVTNVVPCD